MNLKYMIELQGGLMEHIKKAKKIEQFPFKETVLALLVEVGEMANDTKCFKYWSVNREPKETTLEEYSDVGHLVLQLGIMIGATAKEYEPVIVGDLSEQFIKISHKICDFYLTEFYIDYKSVVRLYLGLGKLLGYTPEQIEAAYIEKNKINHNRQLTGY